MRVSVKAPHLAIDMSDSSKISINDRKRTDNNRLSDQRFEVLPEEIRFLIRQRPPTQGEEENS